MYISIYFFILVLPAMLFAMWTQHYVNSTFKKFSTMGNVRNLNGALAARQILDANGLQDVPVEHVSGHLSDHYDPSSRTLRLSDSVYNSTSVAAIGVAAHEAGHAVQHKAGYGAMGLRSGLVPVANIGSMIGPYLAVFGIFFSIPVLTLAGIVLFSMAVLFYLVTLPVEFNASSRALESLERYGMLDRQELAGSREVLRAAALTYVASAAVAVATLLNLILSANRNR